MTIDIFLRNGETVNFLNGSLSHKDQFVTVTTGRKTCSFPRLDVTKIITEEPAPVAGVHNPCYEQMKFTEIVPRLRPEQMKLVEPRAPWDSFLGGSYTAQTPADRITWGQGPNNG